MLKVPYVAGLVLALATPMAAANATVYTFTSFDAPIDLSPPSGPGSYAVGTTVTGINNVGQVVGIAYNLGQQIGFVLDLATNTYTYYPGFPIQAINDSGQLVRYDDFFPAGIDNAGEVVGSAGSGGRHPTYQGYITNPTLGLGAAYFSDPAGNGTQPSDINNSGQIIGTVSLSGSLYSQGFVLDRSTGLYTTLYDPAGVFNYPLGINDVGQIVGSDSAGGYVLDLATGTYTTLIFPGVGAVRPSGISDSGVIVGDYSYSNSAYPTDYFYHGFIATPQASTTVPEPASMALLGISLVGLCWTQRWRHEANAQPPPA